MRGLNNSKAPLEQILLNSLNALLVKGKGRIFCNSFKIISIKSSKLFLQKLYLKMFDSILSMIKLLLNQLQPEAVARRPATLLKKSPTLVFSCEFYF